MDDDEHYDPEKRNGVVIEGVTLPPKQPSGVPWEQHIADLGNLELRSSDIFICAYPKSGTHWLWEVTHMLQSGRVEYEDRTKENLMLEFLSAPAISALPSPRILNTHMPFAMLPRQQMKEKGVRVLHVYRNPKDVLVSMYFHFRQVFPCLSHYSLHQFMQLFLKDDMVYGNYFCFLKQMETFVSENPDIPVFQLSYESMKQNPEMHVQRLATFLGVDASEGQCEKIAEACGFDRMRKVDGTKRLPSDITQHTMSKETKLYRKGQVGDWKNYLTVSMNEEMDAAIKERMAGSSYTLQFT